MTLIPWQGGRPLFSDVTVVCLVANSYIQIANAVAEMAATAECQVRRTCIVLFSTNCFGIFRPHESSLQASSRMISRSSGDDRETSFFCFSAFLFYFFGLILFCYVTAMCGTTARSSSLAVFSISEFFLTLVLRGS